MEGMKGRKSGVGVSSYPRNKWKNSGIGSWACSFVPNRCAFPFPFPLLLSSDPRPSQTPAVESHLSTLLSSLPSSLSLPSAQATHRALTRNAFDRITSLAQGIDGEEWDWKGRVEVDEEEEDEAEGGDTEMKEEPEREKGAQWTVQEVATFQRTGRLPGHAQQSQTS